MTPSKQKVFQEIDWRLRVFDSLSFPTLILKPDREIINANQIFLKRFGLDIDEVVGRKCHEITYGLDEPCLMDICPISKVLSDKKGHSVIRRVIAEDGLERWEDRVFSPILDHNGEVAYVMDSIRDVTRVYALERELRETKEFLEKVIHSSPTAIVAADRAGKILLMNEAAENLFGFKLKDVIMGSKTVESLYPQGQAREIMKKLRDESMGGKGKLAGAQVPILNADGEEIPAEMTASIIYEGDREAATMGIFFDLRDKLEVEKKLKEAQAQLAQSEKMASLGQLAAGVAHEINNPLTGILFYSNLALESLPEDSSLREDLGYVIEDVHRCKDIVKNLLAYSRQTSPSKNIIQLNDMIAQSLNLFRDQKLFGNIKVVKELSDEMMLVHVDKNQMSQVIINLVMNAVAAMNEKGTLTFRTYRDKALQKVYLEVSDSGCGIPEANMSKIFDPFFTTKELGKGTGLGLSTAYGIVQENGGAISVKETTPNGTTFLVELPIYQPSEDGFIF